MKVVLVDDQTLIRKGLISMLAQKKSIEVLGEAKNKNEALSLIERENPDVVIVDYYLGKESGLEVIRKAKKLGCTCKFLLLVHSKDLLSFENIQLIDADGYISLEAHPGELIYALDVIYSGRKYYDPDIIYRMIHFQNKPQTDNSLVESLTSKEKEILQKLGVGFSNKQIAEKLFITENTVKKHVSQVLAKLNLGDRTQAALYANETGLAQYRYNILA